MYCANLPDYAPDLMPAEASSASSTGSTISSLDIHFCPEQNVQHIIHQLETSAVNPVTVTSGGASRGCSRAFIEMARFAHKPSRAFTTIVSICSLFCLRIKKSSVAMTCPKSFVSTSGGVLFAFTGLLLQRSEPSAF